MSVIERFTELRPPLAAPDAAVEADRCLDCFGGGAVAPCVVACPADVDVPTFVRQIADGDPLGAARTIYDANLLAGTCSRVCPVEVLCQGACVLEHEGQRPVEIAALQRYATDEARAAGVPLRPPATRNGHSVAVVGAGPAGLACAGELAARGFSVVVYDEHDEVGGIVRTAIAPYRQLLEPLPAERRQLEDIGVRFELGMQVRPGDDLGADAVFVGLGLGADRPLDLPGTRLRGFWYSLPFIAEVKAGKELELGEHVVVLGGGNTAIDVAREAVRLGAGRVTLAYRRGRSQMPAYPYEVEEAEEEGVELELLAAPLALEGDGRVERIVFERMQLGEPDASGRAAVEPTGSRFRLPADTVVAAIGQQPRPELEQWLALPLPVHAGGDVVNGGASVVQAVAEGKRAARSLEEALWTS